jgi:glutathione-regulated potassium-efflux system ancillary protein KefC
MLDPLIILIALVCGIASRAMGLPALIGYLAAGFVLHEARIEAGLLLDQLANIGITLLLFTIGLKLQPEELLKPRVWGTTIIHMACMQVFFMTLLFLANTMIPDLGLDLTASLIIAFALTFSSTIFVIQVMQEKGEMSSRHANQAIGILLIQDLAAVVFLAGSKGALPKPEALFLLALWPLRGVIIRMLVQAGHGELFTLFGLALALGGAQLFELVGIKGDLGALVIGAMLAGTQKSKELSRNLIHFKDLFLVCFFLSIGLSGWPTEGALVVALVLGLLVLVKPLLYFLLMTWLHTPPRTALLSAAAMGNYSEFGLVVIAVAAKADWVDPQWGSAISLAIAISFLLSSSINLRAHDLYRRFHKTWLRFESPRVFEKIPDTSGARIIVLGMGNIGTGAFDSIAEKFGHAVMGVDINARKMSEHSKEHRRVVCADASDPDFWHRVDLEKVELVLIALTHHQENMLVGTLLKQFGYRGQVAAVVRFSEEADELEAHGFSTFNLYAHAGAGFAAHAAEHLPSCDTDSRP